ncbi:hypothetical protein AGMMS49965_08020 [Bacteroidia bacterium]|nr:hypothetical protein AGMMS49965_08020 [Bacteroidia bacterium]
MKTTPMEKTDGTAKAKQYIYIVQASLELSKCKIGKTNDLERRLSEYNNMTGKSKENIYRYLFSCEVADMTQVEKDIKEKFIALREEKSKEIYFFNAVLFRDYVNFITSHKSFVEEIFIKIDEKKTTVKIIKKTTPTLKERGLSQRDILKRAQRVKYDEFYTRYEDIEKEISMYDTEIWKDKVVFCNCDDAVDEKEGKINENRTSAFALFFINNFKTLELKKLICTHYSGPVDLFSAGSDGQVYLITYEVGKDGKIKIEKQSPKGYTGSFDDPLSLKILKEEADIVCTNPPFSRAIEYWKIVVKSGKKFLIISNISNAINTAYIPYFKDNKVWAGYNRVDWYLNPKRELTRAAGSWFTNIPIKNSPNYKNLKIMPLKEIPEKYIKYDDSKTLLIDDCYVPSNYKKPFAVSARPILNGLLEKGYNIIQEKRYTPYINGEEKFARVLVQKI